MKNWHLEGAEAADALGRWVERLVDDEREARLAGQVLGLFVVFAALIARLFGSAPACAPPSPLRSP